MKTDIENLLTQKNEIYERIKHARTNIVIAKACSPETLEDCLQQNKIYQLEACRLQILINSLLH